MVLWIGTNTVFDLESGTGPNAFTLVKDEQEANRLGSDDADAYVKFLETKAKYITWTKETASEGKDRYVVKGTYKTILTFLEPQKIDDLWVGHPDGEKTTLPVDKEKKEGTYEKCADDALKLVDPKSKELRGLFWIECKILCNRISRDSYKWILGCRIYDWETHI